MNSLGGCLRFMVAIVAMVAVLVVILFMFFIPPGQSPVTWFGSIFGPGPAAGGPGGVASASPSASPGSTSPSGSLAIPSLPGIGPSATAPGSSSVPGSSVTPGGTFPPVSPRTFSSGQAEVKVTGSFTIDSTIALNLPASLSDGGMLWLQFGDSGATVPNSLITWSESGESGVQVGADGNTAIGVDVDCRVDVRVEPVLIEGTFECPGIMALTAAGGLGRVDVVVEFVAHS